MFSKTKESTLLPVRNVNCQHSLCYDIYSEKAMTLFTHKINVVDTGIVAHLPANLLMSVKDLSCCKREWHTVSRFLFGDTQTNVISIPIITAETCFIETKTHLAHITITAIAQYATSCQGMIQYKSISTFL